MKDSTTKLAEQLYIKKGKKLAIEELDEKINEIGEPTKFVHIYKISRFLTAIEYLNKIEEK